MTLYGNLDVSFDDTTKGLKSDYGDNGGVPVGKMGWQPAIATNLSYLGVNGKHPLQPISISSGNWKRASTFPRLPEPSNTTSNTSDTVNGACFRGTASSASPARIGAPS